LQADFKRIIFFVRYRVLYGGRVVGYIGGERNADNYGRLVLRQKCKAQKGGQANKKDSFHKIQVIVSDKNTKGTLSSVPIETNKTN
jgi:hypothetical protein